MIIVSQSRESKLQNGGKNKVPKLVKVAEGYEQQSLIFSQQLSIT